MTSFCTGVRPRERRVSFSSLQPAMYNQRPSCETSSPLGAVPSLPGICVHPVSVCHSHTSFVRGLVAAKPPSGSATTPLKPSVSGPTAHPVHVNVGVALASTSNTSIDSRVPWCTTYNV